MENFDKGLINSLEEFHQKCVTLQIKLDNNQWLEYFGTASISDRVIRLFNSREMHEIASEANIKYNYVIELLNAGNGYTLLKFFDTDAEESDSVYIRSFKIVG